MRIIFAGTPEFAVPALQALIAKHEVLAVYTQPDRPAGRGKKLLASPVKREAEKHEIPVFQPPTLRDQKNAIADFHADVMVVVAYGLLLPPAILQLPRRGCLNIHASLLPRWRGAAPIQRAIEAGDEQTGVSIMQMEAGLDTGPVFQMLNTPISLSDTSAVLHDRLAVLGAQGIIDTLQLLQEHPESVPIPQQNEQATYAQKINKHEAIIDWRDDAVDIHNKVRAFIPWPICETRLHDNRLRIWRSAIAEHAGQSATPGTVTGLEPHLTIACGRGELELHSLQRDGGKPMPSEQFCRGYNINIGDRFDLTEHG